MTTGGWYPLALARDIAPGTSAGTRVNANEFVIWRDNKGDAHVWDDRCPHRGMKLSFGFVRGDHIACLYHGWQYDTAGQCRYIPAHPEINVPPAIKVQKYAVAEAGGIVWACFDDGEAELPAPPIHTEGTSPFRSLFIDCAMELAIGELQKLGGSVTQETGVLTLTVEGTDLHVAIQPISKAECALHVTFANSSQIPSNETFSNITAWSAAFRREAEKLALENKAAEIAA